MVSSVQANSVPQTPPAGLTARARAADAPGAQAGEAAAGAFRPAGEAAEPAFAGVRGGLAEAAAKLDLAVAAGREGAGLLAQMRDLARAAAEGRGPAGADETFQALKRQYGETIREAVKGGAQVLAGEPLRARLDEDADPVEIEGADLRLKSDPEPEDLVSLSEDTSLAGPREAAAAAREADASLARVDGALARLSGASLRLGAHDRFLSALDAALARDVAADMDSEGALLAALQVRQTLAGSNSAIANSAPHQILLLFQD